MSMEPPIVAEHKICPIQSNRHLQNTSPDVNDYLSLKHKLFLTSFGLIHTYSVAIMVFNYVFPMTTSIDNIH